MTVHKKTNLIIYHRRLAYTVGIRMAHVSLNWGIYALGINVNCVYIIGLPEITKTFCPAKP
jgi:hypothetical protein